MMTRREFVQHLALLAAGAAALPQQLQAFERLYEVNTKPLGETGLVQINDIMIGFEQPCDAALLCEVSQHDNTLLAIGLNKRATFRFVSAPDCPMLATMDGFRWTIREPGYQQWTPDLPAISPNPDHVWGTIRYTDQDGLIHTKRITSATGTLTDLAVARTLGPSV